MHGWGKESDNPGWCSPIRPRAGLVPTRAQRPVARPGFYPSVATVFLRAFRAEAMIGIYKRERSTTQPVEIDLDIELPTERAFTSGKVGDTIDYGVVVARLKECIASTRFGLVEEMAERIARIVIDEFQSPAVRVSFAKLGILRDVARVGVTLERRAAP